jgi:hypothetical protein
MFVGQSTVTVMRASGSRLRILRIGNEQRARRQGRVARRDFDARAKHLECHLGAVAFVTFQEQASKDDGLMSNPADFELIRLATLHESIAVETLAQLNESSRQMQPVGGSTESNRWRTVLRNEGRRRVD